jgi:hypothetical protein
MVSRKGAKAQRQKFDLKLKLKPVFSWRLCAFARAQRPARVAGGFMVSRKGAKAQRLKMDLKLQMKPVFSCRLCAFAPLREPNALPE